MQVYGYLDFLGRRQHDAVVVGQLRTVDLMAQAGLGGCWSGFLSGATTASGASSAGWACGWTDGCTQRCWLSAWRRGWDAWRLWCGSGRCAGWRVESGGVSGADAWSDPVAPRRLSDPPRSTLHSPPFTRFRRWSLALLGLSALLTLGIYVSYNMIFVQPQGRYLFPALPAIALAVALGWQEVVIRPAAARWAGVVLLATAGLAGLIGLLRLGVNKWSVAILGGAGLALAGWSLGIPRVSGPWRGASRGSGLWTSLCRASPARSLRPLRVHPTTIVIGRPPRSFPRIGSPRSLPFWSQRIGSIVAPKALERAALHSPAPAPPPHPSSSPGPGARQHQMAHQDSTAWLRLISSPRASNSSFSGMSLMLCP